MFDNPRPKRGPTAIDSREALIARQLRSLRHELHLFRRTVSPDEKRRLLNSMRDRSLEIKLLRQTNQDESDNKNVAIDNHKQEALNNFQIVVGIKQRLLSEQTPEIPPTE